MNFDGKTNLRILSNYRSLHRFVSASLSKRDRKDSEDIVQETFAEAWRNQTTLQEIKSVAEAGVWLRTVAKRKIIDRFRRANAKKRNNGNPSPPLRHQNVPANLRTPSSFAARREAGDLLSSAMNCLSERHSLAIKLRFYQSRSFSEIAAKLNISEKAAQMLVKRALVSLRHQLGGRKSKFI